MSVPSVKYMDGKKVTLKEIAQKTGVSLGTVHRAIYGKPGISEETRKRILAEVERSNYQVDELASVLKRGEKRVMVIMPMAIGDDRFYFQPLWDSIRRASANVSQYKITFTYLESKYSLLEIWRELEHVYDEYLEEIDAIITVADGEQASIWLGRFAKRGIPVVLLSSFCVCNSPIVKTIKVDNVKCGQLAAEFMSYAVKKDEGRILVLAGDSAVYSNRIYTGSFEKVMSGLGYDLECIEGFGREIIEERFINSLERGDTAGIFVGNARNTYAVCSILEERDLGGDLVLVGTDIFEEIRSYFESGMLNAVIYQSQEDQGGMAVEKIRELLSPANYSMSEDTILPPALILKSNYEYYM